MTSIVILDPADANVHEAATANRQRTEAQRAARQAADGGRAESGARIEKVCMSKSVFFGAFLFLTCLAFAQAIAVGIILSRLCFSKKTT